MKILFRNTTKYDNENRENFLSFHQKKYGKSELMKGILINIAAMYILMFNIIRLNWKSVLMLIPIIIIVYFINKYSVDKSEETNNKQKNKEFTFFFYEKYVKIKFKRQFERISYFEIKKIFETDKNFFLYTDNTHSLILHKDGFEIGNSKEFTEFIKRKCPFKYKNKDNK